MNFVTHKHADSSVVVAVGDARPVADFDRVSSNGIGSRALAPTMPALDRP